MLLSLTELFDIVLMTLLIGFLFKDVFKAPTRNNYDPLAAYSAPTKSKLQDFWFAAAVTAPGVIIHELAHKFVAMSFGMQATFHAFYANTTTLFLGVVAVIAKLTGFGFVFLVPGFVSILPNANTTPLQFAMVAFAGPLVHGIFYIGALIYQRNTKRLTRQKAQFLQFFKYINGFLFIINMLPIPGIDGFNVYMSLIKAFGG